MRNRLGSPKASSLTLHLEARSSYTDLTNTSRHIYGLSLAGKAKKSTRRILHCEKLLPHTSQRQLQRLEPVQSKGMLTVGFDDAEQDSVLLKLADMLAAIPEKPRTIKARQRGVASDIPLKRTVKSIARLKPLNPETLISPASRHRGGTVTSRNVVWSHVAYK